MSDIFGSAPTLPSIGDSAHSAEDVYNQVLSSIHPSAMSLDQVAKMQNTMGNQAYNTGLSGSTMQQQALGAGETSAFDADQMKQVATILGLTGGEEAQGLAQDKMDMAHSGAIAGLFGDVAGIGASFLGGPAGGILAKKMF